MGEAGISIPSRMIRKTTNILLDGKGLCLCKLFLPDSHTGEEQKHIAIYLPVLQFHALHIRRHSRPQPCRPVEAPLGHRDSLGGGWCFFPVLFATNVIVVVTVVVE